MKKFILILFFVCGALLINCKPANAQCSICAKSVQQMGDKPAKGFNAGIIYIMLVPYVAIGVVGYKWWKSNRTS
ncbi:MAG: hypothetical protein ABI594_17935 [Ginsengibacter sp.]